MRLALPLAFVILSAGCAARTVDLGGDGGDADAGTSFSPGTFTVATCSDDASAVLGQGYSSVQPAACGAARGPTHAVSSPSDVAALLVGLWDDCTHQAFGIDVGAGASAMQLTGDGHYVAYGADSTSTLVPLASLPPDPHLDAASAASPSATGTFAVVDGSTTYGPGTYELQLRPADGGLFRGQVLITDAPLQLHFFPPNGAEQVFVSPLPWSARQGVCSCVDTTETAEFEDDPTNLATAIVGRWLWCSGDSPPAGNIGIEFGPGNAWYGLDEDTSGVVRRGTAPNESGTYQIVPTRDAGTNIGPEPFTLMLTAGEVGVEIVYLPNPRALLWAVGISTTSDGGKANDYVTCLPMP